MRESPLHGLRRDYRAVSTAGITQVLKAVASEQPDVTIALLHWGSEYNDLISSHPDDDSGPDVQQRRWMPFWEPSPLRPAGGVQRGHRQAGGATPWGTFSAPGTGPVQEYSVLLDLEITRDNATGETKITSPARPPPIATVGSGADHRVVRLGNAMTAYELGALDAVTPDEYAALQNGLDRATRKTQGENKSVPPQGLQGRRHAPPAKLEYLSSKNRRKGRRDRVNGSPCVGGELSHSSGVTEGYTLSTR